jgi:hypothetical protein
MRKKIARTKAKPPQRDQAWFERKVAELKASLEKLPAERREQLERGDREAGLTAPKMKWGVVKGTHSPKREPKRTTSVILLLPLVRDHSLWVKSGCGGSTAGPGLGTGQHQVRHIEHLMSIVLSHPAFLSACWVSCIAWQYFR